MEAVMGIFVGIFGFALLGVCFVNMGKAIWSCFDHCSWAEGAQADPEAHIIDIQSQQVKYVKNGAKFKTTVKFSDGFTFVTHKTNRENHFGSYTISVNRAQIAQAAKASHARALEKKGVKAAAAPVPAAAAAAQPAADSIPVTAPVTKEQPAQQDYPVTAPVTKDQPARQDYPVTAPVTKDQPAKQDYPVTAPVTKDQPAKQDYPVTTPITREQPAQQPQTTRWICPRCGLVHSKELTVCFHCGTPQISAKKFV